HRVAASDLVPLRRTGKSGRRLGTETAPEALVCNSRCGCVPGPHLLPSRNTVWLEPRCAFRREATSAPVMRGKGSTTASMCSLASALCHATRPPPPASTGRSCSPGVTGVFSVAGSGGARVVPIVRGEASRGRPSIQGGMRSGLSCYVGLRSAGSRGLFHDHEWFYDLEHVKPFMIMNYIPLEGIEIVHSFEYDASTLGEQLRPATQSTAKRARRRGVATTLIGG